MSVAVTVLTRRTSKGQWHPSRQHWDEKELPAGVVDTLALTDVRMIRIDLFDGRALIFESAEAERLRRAARMERAS